jgi:hypothetical protein
MHRKKNLILDQAKFAKNKRNHLCQKNALTKKSHFMNTCLLFITAVDIFYKRATSKQAS